MPMSALDLADFSRFHCRKSVIEKTERLGLAFAAAFEIGIVGILEALHRDEIAGKQRALPLGQRRIEFGRIAVAGQLLEGLRRGHDRVYLMIGDHGLQLADAVLVVGKIGVDEHSALAAFRQVQPFRDLRLQACCLLLADGIVEHRHVQFRPWCGCEDLHGDVYDHADDGRDNHGACQQLVAEVLPFAVPWQFPQCLDA